MTSRSVWAACLFLVGVGAAAADEKITVVVAKKMIPAFTFIKNADEFFQLQEQRRDDVPKNVLTDLGDKDLKGGFRLSRTLTEGSFLSRDDLVSGDKAVLAQLPPGMRAVAIKLPPDSLDGGFILPGSKVDVLWSYRLKTGEMGSMTILKDVLIAAVDTQANREKPEKILATTVTLTVKPEESQKLALAASNGELRLCLRPFADLKPAKVEDLKRVPEPKAEDNVPPPPPVAPNEKEGLAAVLPPGMRAVALRLGNDDAGVGFILPGSRVDLLSAKGTKEKIVLENVLVLAVDVQKVGDEKLAEKRMTITVAATPGDAVKLVEAVNKGTVRAVLRRPDEEKK